MKNQNAPPKMVRTEVSHISDNGEILKSEVSEKVYTPIYKRGWERIYRQRMVEIFIECSGKIEIKIVNTIFDSISNKDFSVIVSPASIAKKVGCSIESVKKVVRKLKKIGYLRGYRSPYQADPFCTIPYGMKKEYIAEAQRKWNEEKDEK